MTSADEFHRLLAGRREDADPLVFAGVYDALGARVAEQAGVDGLWVSGYAVAASKLGKPDMGLTTLTEMADVVHNIANAVDLPVVADGEVGYGNAMNAMRTVELYEAAGAVGMQLGDEAEETCPYLGLPTRLLDEADAVLKIRAALAARANEHFTIFSAPQEAFDRSAAYVRAGAGGVLYPWEPLIVEGSDTEVAEKTMAELGGLGAITVAVTAPFLPPVERGALKNAGFDIVVLAVEGLYASAKVQADLWREYLGTGTTGGFGDRMYTDQKDFLPLVDEPRMRALAQQFLSDDYVDSSVRMKYVQD